MYEKHEMNVIRYKENNFVVASLIYGGDDGWSYDSIKPDRSDS